MNLLKEILWDIMVLLMFFMYWAAMLAVFSFVTHAYIPLKLEQLKVIAVVLTVISALIYYLRHYHKKSFRNRIKK